MLLQVCLQIFFLIILNNSINILMISIHCRDSSTPKFYLTSEQFIFLILNILPWLIRRQLRLTKCVCVGCMINNIYCPYNLHLIVMINSKNDLGTGGVSSLWQGKANVYKEPKINEENAELKEWPYSLCLKCYLISVLEMLVWTTSGPTSIFFWDLTLG